MNSAINDWMSVKGSYKSGLRLVLYSSSVSTLILICMSKKIAIKLFAKTELYTPLLFMTLAVIPLAFLTIYSELLKGLKLIKNSQLIQGVFPPALTILFFYSIGRKFDLLGAVGSLNLSVIITAFIGLYMWRQATPNLKGIDGRIKPRKLLESSIPLFFIMVVNLLIDRIPVFVLGIYCESADVGIFSISLRTTMLTSFILISVNSIAAPKFAELYSLKDRINLRRTAVQSQRIMLIFASPILAFFLLFPKFVLSLFGPDFGSGSSVLIILAIGQFINVSFGSVGFLLIMTGHERILKNISILGLAFCFILNIVFVPSLGILGAALATAIVVVIKNIMAFIFVIKLLDINIFSIGSKRNLD